MHSHVRLTIYRQPSDHPHQAGQDVESSTSVDSVFAYPVQADDILRCPGKMSSNMPTYFFLRATGTRFLAKTISRRTFVRSKVGASQGVAHNRAPIKCWHALIEIDPCKFRKHSHSVHGRASAGRGASALANNEEPAAVATGVWFTNFAAVDEDPPKRRQLSRFERNPRLPARQLLKPWRNLE